MDTVIRKTQSNSTTMESSDLLRNKNEAFKTLTMFRTDAVQQFNILFEGVARYRKYSADYKAGKNGVTAADVQQAKTGLVNSITGVLIGGVLTATVLRAIANFLLQNADKYRDEDGEITASSLGQAAINEMIGSLAGTVVFGDFIYDAVASRVFGERYYGISDSGLETISDLLSDIAEKDLSKLANWERLLQDLCSALGVPYRNVKEMGEAVFFHVEDIKNGELLSMNASDQSGVSAFYRRLYRALRDGNEEKAERIRRELTGLGKTESEILSGMRAAIKKSDKEYTSIFDEMMQDVEATSLYERLTEKEKKKVQSGIAGYIADTILAESTDGELTKANAKAARYAEQGVAETDYFLAQIVKNAFFADADESGKVSKQEYGHALDEGEYEGKIRALLYGLK